MKMLLSLCVLAQLTTAAAAQTAAQPSSTGASGEPAAVEALIEGLRQQLAAQQELIARHSAEIAEQRAMIDALRRQVGETSMERAPVSSVGQPLPRPAGAGDQKPGTAETVTDPELPQRFVSVGEFPGSIQIPGSDTAFKLGGQARATFVQSLNPLGEDDRFIASSIPVGGDLPGKQARTTYTAAPSRLNFDLRSPTPFGGMRTFVEYDFSGTGNAAHLRHAFIQSGHWIFGQTWSTFSDPEAKPTDIDFEGLNAISLFRQPQIRYTTSLRDGVSLSAAAENPAPDLTGAAGVNLTPDLVARVRWDPAKPVNQLVTNVAHVQAAILVRSLRGAPTNEPQTTVTTGGFGVNVSGVLVPVWDSAAHVKFATNNGWGIGRYIKDLEALGGQDAVYDSTLGQLRALGVASGYVGYERQWRPWLQSGLTYGVVRVSNLDIQPDSALRRTQRTTVYVNWLPVPHAELVAEYLLGERVNKNGERGTANQIQIGWKLTDRKS